MIIIVSAATDVHYRCVARALEDRGVDVCVAEYDRLPAEARLSMRSGIERSVRWTTRDGRTVDLDRASCVWYRRLFPPQFYPPLASASDEAWAVREWRDAMQSAFMVLDARMVSAPAAQELAGVKPYQLRIAETVGLRIPDTLMTNDADAAREFVARHEGRVVHKVVRTPRDRFVGTKRWTADDEAELPWLRSTPTFFQQQIVAPAELRVTVIGRRVFAAEFDVRWGVVDARSELDADWRAVRLPDELETRIGRLMDRLDLQYGTIDLKRTSVRSDDPDGYVFLEINPQGQFLYVEIKTGIPLTDAMAEFLATGDSSARV